MKQQTADLFRTFIPRFSFQWSDEGLKVEHDLTDEEILSVVEQEYGPTTQHVEELFNIILKKAVKLAVDSARV